MSKKGIIVGNYNWYYYEEALAEGFEKLGVKIIKFKLPSFSPKQKILNLKQLIYYNKKLIRLVKDSSPEFIFFYRTNEIYSSTLKIIKKKYKGTKIIFFHNDNPFYGFMNKVKYFIYLNALKYTDITYVYRPSNIKDALKLKAKNVQLLYPYYCTKIHLSNKINHINKINDIVFIGYCENHRVKLINALIKAGINVKVYGPGWSKIANKLKWPNTVINGPVYGVEYTKVISESKMALCFLSKINNDVYTRRNFEIPAIGTILVSEFSKELSELFIEDKEIILFKNRKQLVNKVKALLNDNQFVKKITLAGHNKITKSGHSEIDRAKQIQCNISELHHD